MYIGCNATPKAKTPKAAHYHAVDKPRKRNTTPPTRQQLITRANKMRLNPTPGEKALSQTLEHLKAGLIETQVIIGWNIVDFILPHRNLLIEVDGSYHYASAEQTKWDDGRDQRLITRGFDLVHVDNHDTHRHGKIKKLLEEHPPSEENYKRYLKAMRWYPPKPQKPKVPFLYKRG